MRHGIVVFAFVLAAGIFLGGDSDAGNLEPPGPPAPTMKTIQQVEPRVAISSSVVIAAPGSYYLTGDVFGSTGQVGIQITSSFVTLDLNGFSLIGGPGTLDGIRINFAGTRHVVIRNGAIRGWAAHGILATVATETHIEDLRLDGNGGSGMVIGARSIVRNTTASANVIHGIEVGSGSTVIGCTAAANSQSGIVLGQNSVVSSSTASNNAANGIFLNTASTATDCTALLNGTGFSVGTGSRVAHSAARQNTVGMFGNDTATIEDCTAEANTDDGIKVVNRGVVRGSLARGNTNDGIEATGGQNRIEDNHSTANGVGIAVFGNSNLIVKNSTGANTNTAYLSLGVGNKYGEISTDPATAGPWANFDL